MFFQCPHNTTLSVHQKHLHYNNHISVECCKCIAYLVQVVSINLTVLAAKLIIILPALLCVVNIIIFKLTFRHCFFSHRLFLFFILLRHFCRSSHLFAQQYITSNYITSFFGRAIYNTTHDQAPTKYTIHAYFLSAISITGKYTHREVVICCSCDLQIIVTCKTNIL